MDLGIIRNLVVKDLGIDTPAGSMTGEELRRQIADLVEELLRNDMDRLMSILYRVDVAERLVKQAFAGCTLAELPTELARLILERELQKAESRRRHRQTNG